MEAGELRVAARRIANSPALHVVVTPLAPIAMRGPSWDGRSTGLIFSFVYDGDSGLVASIWRAFGAEAPHLLASTDTAMLAVLIVIVWKYFGFHMMLFIAALQSLDTSLIEAACFDGATWSHT